MFFPSSKKRQFKQKDSVMSDSCGSTEKRLIEYWCIPSTKRALRKRQYGICVLKTSFRPLIEGQNALAPKLVPSVSRDISE